MIGDVPIFIAHDSADVWAHRELFQLDEDGYPTYTLPVFRRTTSAKLDRFGKQSCTTGRRMNKTTGDGGKNV